MIKNNKVNLIKSLIDIDDKFKIRMLNFFKNNFKDNLFYNENYYFDILKFCDNNKIRFSLSEFLAINFYYFSKSQNLNSSYYLTEYLKLEEFSIQDFFGLDFLANSEVKHGLQVTKPVASENVFQWKFYEVDRL